MLVLFASTELTAQLTTFMRTDVRADAQTTNELTAQLTTFMRTDVRADAHTTTELTAQLTTFMRTDVRADAQTIIELTAQLAIELTTEPITQLIEKTIMRVCINAPERLKQLGVGVTLGGHSATIAKEQHRRNNHSMNHSITHSATTAKEHHHSGIGKRSQAAVVSNQNLWLVQNIFANRNFYHTSLRRCALITAQAELP